MYFYPSRCYNSEKHWKPCNLYWEEAVPMIISVSRRTDIPALYSPWFFNRLKEQYVLVRNPVNFHQISRVPLSPQVVDAIVFWTKNPVPMLEHLSELKDYNYYFQFTLTPYDQDIEPGLPSKKDVLIPAFIALSKAIGYERVIWRYDPILLNRQYTIDRHIQSFQQMAQTLKGYTKKCVISFIDSYRNTARHKERLTLKEIRTEDMYRIAGHFSGIARNCGMELSTCGEAVDLSPYGIEHGRCIDPVLLHRITGRPLNVRKDPGQRKECGCVSSIDIGAYNTCINLCAYCYANYNEPLAHKNFALHNPASPLLFGEIGGNDRITERKMRSFFTDRTTQSGQDEARRTK